MKNPDVFNMVLEYLVSNKYDGLWLNENGVSCACILGDLAPCGEMNEACTAGYKVECTCGEGCDFHVGPTRKVSDE